MFGIDDHRRRRNINLAGNSSSTSSESILDQAKRRRLEREDNRRKQDSATIIQSCYRGHVEVLRTRSWLREVLSGDLHGIMGLRALVLIGLDRQALVAWSEAMKNGAFINEGLCGPQRESWIVLLRQASLLLLRSVANAPQQPESMVHLQVLQLLISSADTGMAVASYLLPRGCFHLISVAFRKVVSIRKLFFPYPFHLTVYSP
jgi:ubiquitin-protein ligase E3 C